MFYHLFNIFKEGEFVVGYDQAAEVRRFMNEIEIECEGNEDRINEWQVLMGTKKGMFW